MPYLGFPLLWYPTWPKRTWGRKGLSCLIIAHHEWKSEQKLKARIWRHMNLLWRNDDVTGLLFKACHPTLFLMHSGTTCPWVAFLTVEQVLSHQSLIKRKASQAYPQANLVGEFSQSRFSSRMTLAYQAYLLQTLSINTLRPVSETAMNQL